MGVASTRVLNWTWLNNLSQMYWLIHAELVAGGIDTVFESIQSMEVDGGTPARENQSGHWYKKWCTCSFWWGAQINQLVLHLLRTWLDTEGMLARIVYKESNSYRLAIPSAQYATYQLLAKVWQQTIINLPSCLQMIVWSCSQCELGRQISFARFCTKVFSQDKPDLYSFSLGQQDMDREMGRRHKRVWISPLTEVVDLEMGLRYYHCCIAAGLLSETKGSKRHRSRRVFDGSNIYLVDYQIVLCELVVDYQLSENGKTSKDIITS